MTMRDSAPLRMRSPTLLALREHWKLFMTEGVLMALLGVLAIAMPVAATLAVDVWIGWLFLIAGVIGLIGAFYARRFAAGLWAFLTSALLTVAGVLLILHPIIGALTITWVLTAFFVAEGVVQIVAAFAYRHAGLTAWMALSGVADLVLAAIIVMSWPLSAAWALGLLAGVNLLTSGAALIVAALRGRELARDARVAPTGAPFHV
jgi:uncharacterized membrane protein HdeD (DUF308 family)